MTDREGSDEGPAFLVLEIALLAVGFVGLALYSSRAIWNTDIWWHVVVGRLFTERGALIMQDTFSAIDPDKPWISIQWAYGVLVHWLDTLGGPALLKTAHSFIQWLAIVIFWAQCRFRLKLGRWSSLVLFALLVVLYADRFRARPHVFNLLFSAILYPWMVVGAAALSRRICVATALIMVLWANLHAGGAFIFLIAAFCLPFAAILQRLVLGPAYQRELARTAVWFASALFPALLSPLFVRSIVHTLGMRAGSEAIIPEWRPVWRYFEAGSIGAHYFSGAFPTILLILWALLVARVLGAFSREGKSGLEAALKRAPLHCLGLAIAMSVLSHRSIRFAYFTGFTALILWQPIRDTLGLHEISRKIRRGLLITAWVLLTLMAFQSRVTLVHGDLGTALSKNFGPDPIDARKYPVAVTQFMVDTGFEGTVWAPPAWGGYLLYHLWPKVRVSSDGRGNQDEAATLDHLITSNRANYEDRKSGPELVAIYDKYNVDAVVRPAPMWPPGFVPQGWIAVTHMAGVEFWLRPTPDSLRYLDRLKSRQ